MSACPIFVWNINFSWQVVEKLVDIVHYIHVEINNTFGSSGTSMAQCLLLNQSNIVPADPHNVLLDGDALSTKSMVNCQRLGPAGLALHYANIIIQIYSIVSSFTLFMLSQLKILSYLLDFVTVSYIMWKNYYSPRSTFSSLWVLCSGLLVHYLYIQLS